MKRLRRRTARIVRGIYNRWSVPVPVERALRRIAHALQPHVLRCRLCGAEFVAVSGLSFEHAARAFDHSLEPHDSEEADRG